MGLRGLNWRTVECVKVSVLQGGKGAQKEASQAHKNLNKRILEGLVALLHTVVIRS